MARVLLIGITNQITTFYLYTLKLNRQGLIGIMMVTVVSRLSSQRQRALSTFGRLTEDEVPTNHFTISE